ncbi:MAG: hypothetical protein AB1916_11640 [Thermodesulfobacteriota bacterium]
MPDPDHTRLLDALAGRLRELAPALLAVSGGLDSRLLAFLARSRGLDYETVLFRGPHLSRTDTGRAALWLGRLGLPFHAADARVLDLPEVAGNTRERCYACKRELFTLARSLAGARTLADGTNADDAASFRPGIRALRELGVRSPYAELGVTKDQVRSLAAAVGLDDPQQPSRPCLLTRLAYGLRPDADTLERLAQAEDRLAALGLERFRLRIPGPGACALQIDAREKPLHASLAQEIDAFLARSGFTPYAIIWSENVSGLYDEQGG